MYKTILFSFPSDKVIHYSVNFSETRCGIDLRRSQAFLEYNLGEKDICFHCAQKNIPQLKDWNPPIKITFGEHAKRCLHHLYILLQNLEEELQIYWGIYEFQTYGCNDLSNWLLNEKPIIEGFDEDMKEVQVSYLLQDGREKGFIEFEKIADIYQGIKKDVMWTLRKFTCEPGQTNQWGYGAAYHDFKRLQVLSSFLNNDDLALLGLDEALSFENINIMHVLEDSNADIIDDSADDIIVKYEVESGEQEAVINLEKIRYFIRGIKNNMDEILYRRRN